MRNNKINVVGCDFGFADIYIAGSYELCKNICADFCLDGFCVNISTCEYIYTGGAEYGCKVGLINYPRFPLAQEVLTQKANDLALKLVLGLYQSSATIVTPDGSYTVSRRDD